jgi:hypothetical protein
MEKLKLETQVVGTGPYRLVEYVPKSHIKLRKNPDYWGKPLPYLDEVTFRILEEEDARVAGLRAGSLDYGFLTPEGIQRLRGDSRIVISSRPRTYLYAFVVNRQRKPWSDPRARQALSLATDRQEIIEKVFSGGATMAGPIPFGFGDWYLSAEELRRGGTSPISPRRRSSGRAGVRWPPSTSWSAQSELPGLAVVFAEQLKRIGLNANPAGRAGCVLKRSAADLQLTSGERGYGASTRTITCTTNPLRATMPRAARKLKSPAPRAHDDRPSPAHTMSRDPADPAGRRAQRLARERQRDRGAPGLRQGVRTEPVHLSRVGPEARVARQVSEHGPGAARAD